jgi:hypothetical protein
MTLAPRILALTLVLTAAGSAIAQEATATAPAEPAATATAPATPASAASNEETGPAETESAESLREEFTNLLRRHHPPELASILRLDPALLSNQQFMAEYPLLARFVQEHPAVRRNPQYYLRNFEEPLERRSAASDIAEVFAIMTAMGLSLFVFTWLVRTVIEQRRWNRLSRTQSEVHNKILDRFSTSTELLEYIRTPAGTKFLESAPIPLHADKAIANVPATRVIWSIQVGIVVVAGAVGMLLVSLRLAKEPAEAMFAMGAIAFCVGGGFIASALVSMALSRRLGLWDGPPETAADEPGLMR